jgi:transposase
MSKGNFIFVGCDSHAKTLVNMIAVNDGPAEQWTTSNSRSGRHKLIRILKQKAQGLGGARIVVVYEASGNGFILHDELQAAGIECHVLAPTKIERSEKHKRNKRDIPDAQRMLDIIRAHMLAGTGLPAVWVPDAQTRDDRETVRMRHDVGEKLAAIKTQIQSLLKRNGVEKPEGMGPSRSHEYRRWLWLLAGEENQGRDWEQQWGKRIGFRNALSSLLRQLEFYETEIRQADQAIKQLCEMPHLKPVVAALDAEVGVGRLGAVTYAAEMGDFTRFRRRQQVGSYWGLTPTSNESGEHNDRKGHISRQGAPRMRRILCQSTWSRVQHHAGEREKFNEFVKRNPKRKKVALVAGMRRLSVRLWHVGREVQLKLKAT